VGFDEVGDVLVYGMLCCFYVVGVLMLYVVFSEEGLYCKYYGINDYGCSILCE